MALRTWSSRHSGLQRCVGEEASRLFIASWDHLPVASLAGVPENLEGRSQTLKSVYAQVAKQKLFGSFAVKALRCRQCLQCTSAKHNLSYMCKDMQVHAVGYATRLRDEALRVCLCDAAEEVV